MRPLKKLPFSKSSQSKQIHLQNVIKPLYIVTSLLGLVPYSVTFSNSRHSFVIIRNSIYLNSICGLSLCMIIFAFLALHIQEVLMASESSNFTEAILTQMNYILELVGFIMFCVVAYVCAFINRSKYLKILNQITTVWYSLPLNNNSKRILSNLQFHVNVVCLGSLLVVFITQICVNCTRNNSFWKIILVTFTFNIPQMIQFVALAFYYMLVMLVVALVLNIKWHCRRLLQTNMSATEDVGSLKNRETYTLRKMEYIYVKVFEIKTKINKTYQGPILATALQSFHSMVSEAHIIYHGLIVQKSLTMHEILNCSIWIIYQILKMYSLAYSGNVLKVEALKIGQILYKIPTEKRDARWLMEVGSQSIYDEKRDFKDSYIKLAPKYLNVILFTINVIPLQLGINFILLSNMRKIQHFSTLMHHQNIELSVYGYFPLDATLIYNIITSATMYLIILVQFDKRE